jgi:putative oxidoreductase
MQKRISKFLYMNKVAIITTICGLLILLFTYASFSKLVDMKSSIGQMNNQPMPNWMTPYLAWSIPIIEILIATALMFDQTRKLGLWASLILMTTFTIYVSLAVFNVFDKVPCSCGGVLKDLGWTEHLFFNIFFTCISLFGIYLMKKVPNRTESVSQAIFA